VEQFTVWNVDKPEKTWEHMEVPEKISVQFYISQKLGQEVSAERDPVIGTGGVNSP
jgi:hypothetical protein